MRNSLITILALVVSTTVMGQTYTPQKLVPGVEYKVQTPKTKQEFIAANRNYMTRLVKMAQESIDALGLFKAGEARNLNRQLTELMQQMNQAGPKALESRIPPSEYTIPLDRIREDAEAQLIVWRHYELQLIWMDIMKNIEMVGKKDPETASAYRQLVDGFQRNVHIEKSEFYKDSPYQRYRKDYMTTNQNLKRILTGAD